MRESYTQYCRNFIKDELPDFEGKTTYGCDLGYMLTDSINADGSAICSRQEAMKYIQEWWYDCAEFYDYYKMNFGEMPYNPFEDIEKFHCAMIIEGVNNLLGQVEVIGDAWNDEIEITEESGKKIIAEVFENKEIEF